LTINGRLSQLVPQTFHITKSKVYSLSGEGMNPVSSISGKKITLK
jgi:hypothetical protein